MTTYDNTNRGVLFDNDRKESDTHPDMTGTLNINGVDHWFSAWWKDCSKGEFLSLSIGKPKDNQQGQQTRQQQRPPEQPQRRGNRPSNQQLQGRGGYGAPVRQSSGFDDFDDAPPFDR